MARAPLVVPGAGLQSALDGHLLALAEVPPGDLGKAIPRDDRVILRLLLAAAEELVARHRERRDVLPAGEAAHLRIACEATREEDPIHGPSPSRSVGSTDLDPASPAG
jgi:hypothetical protein